MFDGIAPWRIKLVRTIFSVLAVGIGGLLAWAGWFHRMENHKTVAAWVKTPCKVLRWDVEVTDTGYGSTVDRNLEYEYDFGGATYRSGNYDEATDWEVDLREFEKQGAMARRGPAYCYVNPAKPSDASFLGPRLWYPWSLVGGGAALALTGLVFFILTWIPKRPLPVDDARTGRKLLAVFGIGLVGMGIFLGFRQGTPDLLHGLILRSGMIEVPAKVEASWIYDQRGSGRRSHMTYHMVYVVYSYEQEGRRWMADRSSFGNRAADGGTINQARERLAKYPRGSEATAWVHPSQPWISALSRNMPWDSIFHIAPLGLTAGGVWMIISAWRMRNRNKQPAP